MFVKITDANFSEDIKVGPSNQADHCVCSITLPEWIEQRLGCNSVRECEHLVIKSFNSSYLNEYWRYTLSQILRNLVELQQLSS